MAIQEHDLVTINASDLTSSDFVRVLDGDSSRKVTLDSFIEASTPLLEAEGFIRSTPDTDPVLRTITANTTLVLGDGIINADTTAGNVTVNLMAASDVSDGSTTKIYRIKKKSSDVNKVSVVPSGGATIDGASSLDLFNYNSVSIFSDGFNWFTL